MESEWHRIPWERGLPTWQFKLGARLVAPGAFDTVLLGVTEDGTRQVWYSRGDFGTPGFDLLFLRLAGGERFPFGEDVVPDG